MTPGNIPIRLCPYLDPPVLDLAEQGVALGRADVADVKILKLVGELKGWQVINQTDANLRLGKQYLCSQN